MMAGINSRLPMQLCEEESQLYGQHSRMYFTGLAALPWRTQLRSGALPLNAHVRPLVISLCGPRRTEMQALLWPHILHRYNVLFVDNPLYAPHPLAEYTNTMDSGFVVPLLLRIAESCGKRHMAQMYSEGPLAVVITSNIDESRALVNSIITVEKQMDRNFRVVNIFETKNDQEFQKKSLLASENCDVLVVTMNAVLQLFLTQGRLGSPPINVLKVELVVLRNIDVMIRISSSNVDQIMTRFLVNPDINYVFAASSPSQAVRRIVTRLENTVFTVVTNTLDAILYEKLPIHVMESNSKLPWSMSALNTFVDRSAGERVVLYVGSDKQAVDLKKMIEMSKKKGKLEFEFQTISESSLLYESIGVIRDWWTTESKDKCKMLAIPEGLSTDFGITDADMVIHLSAPATMQQFMKRFCCIKTSFTAWAFAYASLAKGLKNVAMPKIPCRILVDEGWRPMLPLLVHVAGASPEYSIIPASVVSAAQNILKDQEFLRVPPCVQQIYVGECMTTESCGARHYQGPKAPLVSVLGVCKSFEFSIMRFLSPSHLVVRILRYRTQENLVVQLDKEQKFLDEHLANVLDELPEPLDGVPAPGVICGVLSRDKKRLLRVEIVYHDQDFTRVMYLDEGVGMGFTVMDGRHPRYPARLKSKTKFYPLPEEIQVFPKTWTNLIVANILPSALELGWRPAVCGDVYAAMREYIVDKSVMESQPIFATEDFIFVENFKCWKMLDGSRTCALQMKNILNRFAGNYVPNLDHLEKLKRSYEARSISRGKSTIALLPLCSKPLTPIPNQGEGDACLAGVALSPDIPPRKDESLAEKVTTILDQSVEVFEENKTL